MSVMLSTSYECESLPLVLLCLYTRKLLSDKTWTLNSNYYNSKVHFTFFLQKLLEKEVAFIRSFIPHLCSQQMVLEPLLWVRRCLVFGGRKVNEHNGAFQDPTVRSPGTPSVFRSSQLKLHKGHGVCLFSVQ